jgi:magnesium transporter
LIKHNPVALSAFDAQETAIKVFKDYNRVDLPVVDSGNTLLRIVTVDDILDVAEEEQTEDFLRFGAVQDAIISPLQATVPFVYKKRIAWLILPGDSSTSPWLSNSWDCSDNFKDGYNTGI